MINKHTHTQTLPKYKINAVSYQALRSKDAARTAVRARTTSQNFVSRGDNGLGVLKHGPGNTGPLGARVADDDAQSVTSSGNVHVLGNNVFGVAQNVERDAKGGKGQVRREGGKEEWGLSGD